jgi:hypothetical protein
MTPGIVLKPGTRGWNRAGLKKKQGKKKLGVTRLTRSKTRLQPVDFCFLLKRRRFDLKKLTRATRSKPRTRALDSVGSKNY